MTYTASYLLIVDDPAIEKVKGLVNYCRENNNLFPKSKVDFELCNTNNLLNEEEKLPDTESDNVIVKFLRKSPVDKLFGNEYYNALKGCVHNLFDMVKDKYENITYVNGLDGILKLRNKKKLGQELVNNGVPHPDIYDVSPEEIVDMVRSGSVICAKVPSGGKGFGITKFSYDGSYLISTTFTKNSVVKKNYLRATNEHVINVNVNKKKATRFLYELRDNGNIFQKWIDSLKITHEGVKKIFDIRVNLVYHKYNNSEIALLPRISNNKLITNVSVEQNVEGPYEMFRDYIGWEGVEKTVQLAIDAANCFPDVNITGVDVMWTLAEPGVDNPYSINWKGKRICPYIIELNIMPGVKSPCKCGMNPYKFEVIGAKKDSGVELIDREESSLKDTFRSTRLYLEKRLYQNPVSIST